MSPLSKKGAKSDPSNYRPISVILTVLKIYEKIIYDQLYDYLNTNNLLTRCQSRIKSFHSTLTALLEATNHWSVNIDNGMLNGVVFIDLKKAFNTIDHEIILLKLRNYGVDSLDEIQNVINSELKNLNNWLIANRFSLNITKTEFMIIGSRQRINVTQNKDIAIKIRDREINRADVMKSLGEHIGSHLSWSEHVHKILKKISSAIGALKWVRPFISCKTAVQVYSASIQPHFDYCCSVWDELGDTLATKLQNLQNRAARVTMRSSYDADAGALLTLLQLDSLSIRRTKIKAQLMYKILKGNSPSYLKSLLSARTFEYNFRNNQCKLNIPKPRTNYLKRSICYSGALLWNNLLQEVRNLPNLSQFKRAINDYYVDT